MIKRYVRFRAEGTGESVGRVRVEGLCERSCDPLQVAMAREHDLTRCSRVSVVVEPAFAVACNGDRRKTRADIRRQARLDAQIAQEKEERRRCEEDRRRLRELFMLGGW